MQQKHRLRRWQGETTKSNCPLWILGYRKIVRKSSCHEIFVGRKSSSVTEVRVQCQDGRRGAKRFRAGCGDRVELCLRDNSGTAGGWSVNATVRPAGVTLKCLLHKKSARGEIITDHGCDMSPLIKISPCWPHNKSPIIGSPSPRKVFCGAGILQWGDFYGWEKFPPADNLPVKIRPARLPPGRDGFLAVNCRPGRDIFGGRSYNKTQAGRQYITDESDSAAAVGSILCSIWHRQPYTLAAGCMSVNRQQWISTYSWVSNVSVTVHAMMMMMIQLWQFRRTNARNCCAICARPGLTALHRTSAFAYLSACLFVCLSHCLPSLFSVFPFRILPPLSVSICRNLPSYMYFASYYWIEPAGLP